MERNYGKCPVIDFFNLIAECPNENGGLTRIFGYYRYGRRSGKLTPEAKSVNVRGRRSGKPAAVRVSNVTEV